MKKLMSILIASLLVIVFTNIANAQKTVEQKAQYQTQEMTKSLTLSNDQVTKINKINLKYAEKIDYVKQQKLEPEAKQDQLNDLRQEREQEFKTVLTAEQFAKYQEMKPEWKKQNREKRKLEQQKAVGQENR